jgi:serine/threonine-protein kinase
MTPPSDQDPDASSIDPLPGRVIAGNFRIDKLIGSGAMGNVYKAEQLSLGKPVALKVLHAHLMSDEKLVMRFKREAKSASLLNHPNSIQIIDSGQDAGGTLYIAMELLSGRDLAQIIRDEFPLPIGRVVRIMLQVLSALDEAHAQGIVHRDLKPSNIMLIERRGERDFVKVCDFGIAKAMAPDGKEDDRQAMLTLQGLVCGTPEYMAPEQARAEPLDGRADLYSAAVILYQLVTGDIPFRADSPMGIVSRHLAEPPLPPSQRRPDLPIPRFIDDIVLRGMEKQREHRFPTAVAFREALEAVVGTGSGQFTPYPPGVRAAMPTAPQMGGAPPSQPGVQAENRYGPTADVPRVEPVHKLSTGRFVGLLVLAAAVAAAAVIRMNAARNQPSPSAVTPAAAVVAVAPPAAPATPPPTPAPPAAVAPAPTPAEAPAAPAEAPAPAVTAPADEEAPPRTHGSHDRDRARSGKSDKSSSRPSSHASPSAEPASAPAAPALAAPKPLPAAAVAAAAAPEPAAPRGAPQVLAEGEKLLGQGEVKDACARGEEAKHMNPRLPAVYKFLGKCYMRGGSIGPAKENYKKYLELAPTAPDAPFVQSIIK